MIWEITIDQVSSIGEGTQHYGPNTYDTRDIAYAISLMLEECGLSNVVEGSYQITLSPPERKMSK